MAIFDASSKLFPLFQDILEELVDNESFSGVPVEMTEQFLPLLFNYLRCFNAWKTPDKRNMVRRIQDALVALDDAKLEIQTSNSSNPKSLAKICTEIERMRAGLERIAGPDALARFDEQRRRGSEFPVLIPVPKYQIKHIIEYLKVKLNKFYIFY